MGQNILFIELMFKCLDQNFLVTKSHEEYILVGMNVAVVFGKPE